MSLEMRPVCEKCRLALSQDGPAFICSFECTFCRGCSEAMFLVCPNCKGELVPRPKRLSRIPA